MIGNDVRVNVVDIRGGKVRLGIKAPRRLAIHRKEVYDAIRREQGDAGTLTSANIRLELEEKRAWLASYHLHFVSGGTSIFSVEDFGSDYIVMHYKPATIDGREQLVRASLFSCKSRNEAIAALLHGVVCAWLQPDTTMNAALFNALDAVARDCDSRNQSADVPPAPVAISSK